MHSPCGHMSSHKDIYDEQASGDPIVLHRTMNKGPGNLFKKKVWTAQVHYTKRMTVYSLKPQIVPTSHSISHDPNGTPEPNL